MLLDREFDPDFSNPNSVAYKQFTEDFAQMVSGICSNLDITPEYHTRVRIRIKTRVRIRIKTRVRIRVKTRVRIRVKTRVRIRVRD